MSSQLIHEYLKQRKAKRAEQVTQLKAKLEEDEKYKSIDSKSIEKNRDQLDEAPLSPDQSQKTLFNYFDTRTGRMLRSCIATKNANSVDYDVFYSVSGLKAKAYRKEAYSKDELKKFKRMDPRLPLSGLNIFMWGIQKKDIKRRFHMWNALSEEEQMAYRKKAKELGAEMEYFRLSLCIEAKRWKTPTPEALQAFRAFVKDKWDEAEKMSESIYTGFRNKAFVGAMKANLIRLYRTSIKDQREIKVVDIPKTGFDVFASEKGFEVAPVTRRLCEVRYKQHDDMWDAWCALDDQQRDAYIKEAAAQNTLPYFRPWHTEMYLDVKFDKTLEGHNAKWYQYICTNFATANEVVDRVMRMAHAKRQASIVRPPKHFTYTNAQRSEWWLAIKRRVLVNFHKAHQHLAEKCTRKKNPLNSLHHL